MAGRLDGKVAVITGGASGIGRGTVDLFVKEGARVVVADLGGAKRADLEASHGARIRYQATDVSDEAQVKAAIDLAVSAFGRLDIIFNNAGMVGVAGPIETTDMAGFDHTVGVLLKGVVAGMKHAVPVMKAQGCGAILSTASVAGVSGGFGPHVYSACKAGVVNLTRSVALELAPFGIRVNAICPGGIATPIFARGLGLTGASAEQTVGPIGEMLKHFQPLPRTGEPEDIAEAAVFLCSDAARFVTGHALVVDGGLTAGPMPRPERGAEFAKALGIDPAAWAQPAPSVQKT